MMMLLLFWVTGAGAQTIEECQEAAGRNYPLVKQYGLIERTAGLTVDNLQKGWLPQVSAMARASLQSDVATWPGQMQDMLRGMGLNMKGLSKDQYRIGVDVQQTVYDGGRIRSEKQIAREQGLVEAAQNETAIYGLRRRVNELFFAALLIDEQIRLNRDLQQLFESNEKKLASMFEHGTAAESDYLNVKAERLNVVQQLSDLEAQRTTLLRLLSVFCGIEVNAPTAPHNSGEWREERGERKDSWAGKTMVSPSGDERGTAGWSGTTNFTNYPKEREMLGTNFRPELRAIDAQIRLADAQEHALDALLRPKAGVFVQGFYGYPGYNMFEDMMHHRWSLGGMIGINVSWNIGALYTRKNDKMRLGAQREMLGVQRDVFLLNNRLEQIQHDEDIARYSKLMADDEQIIALRQSVRKAAESKLQHGIIDVNGLVREIYSENAARVQQSIHRIQMLKEIYDLKFTTGE